MVNLSRYLRNRRYFEIGFWTLYFLIQGFTNAAVVRADFERGGLSFVPGEPLLLEFSSMAAMALLLPAIIAFDRRYPLRLAELRRALPVHLLATAVYTLGHVLLMVGIRQLLYPTLLVIGYQVDDWPAKLGYEYLKDFRAYAGILATIYLYRFVLLRLQGEASVLAEPEDSPAAAAEPRPQRLLVKKLGKEFLVNVDDIEWLAAAGNYVNLHIGIRTYPLRGTLSGIERLLDTQRFVRVHRSYIVNLDQIDEIEPTENGDARIKLQQGVQIPLSRRYREALRERI